MTYWKYEISFDRHFPHAERIFRIVSDYKDEGNRSLSASTPNPLLPTLLPFLPDAEAATRMFPLPGFVSANKLDKFRENDFVFADSSVFRVFGFEFLAGEANSALNGPYRIVLTEAMAI